MAALPRSPLSSPRLPSPPPIAEDQLGPKSPAATAEEEKHFSSLDHGASRRIRVGTRAEDMAEGPPLLELSEIDSAFQLTEHLKALHNFLTHPIGSNASIAVDRDMAEKLAQPPDNVDKALWLYELCRFLTQKANAIITALFSDDPPCSSMTCPEMRASEWQYLCAVHDPPKSCCAVDYCCHTLDWAANTLTSPKNFPSRLAMGSDQSTQHQQIRSLTNIFRRVYRIFAHAWFQHRDMFWKVEARTGLYIFFKTVCDVYGLIPEDNYTIPPEAEGEEPAPEAKSAAPTIILKRDTGEAGSMDEGSTEMDTEHTLSTAGTTKRHRHSPSVGATAVSTVVEESEDEGEEGAVTNHTEAGVPATDSSASTQHKTASNTEASTQHRSTLAKAEDEPSDTNPAPTSEGDDTGASDADTTAAIKASEIEATKSTEEPRHDKTGKIAEEEPDASHMEVPAEQHGKRDPVPTAHPEAVDPET